MANSIKIIFKSFTIIFCTILFIGCSKNEAVLTPQQQAIKNLTGLGNRFWQLQDLYVNNIRQTLSTQQKGYNKTYTLIIGAESNGTLMNSDGYKGVWEIVGDKQLKETFTNISGLPVQITYIINELSGNKLDISYTVNNTLVREVYYAA